MFLVPVEAIYCVDACCVFMMLFRIRSFLCLERSAWLFFLYKSSARKRGGVVPAKGATGRERQTTKLSPLWQRKQQTTEAADDEAAIPPGPSMASPGPVTRSSQ